MMGYSSDALQNLPMASRAGPIHGSSYIMVHDRAKASAAAQMALFAASTAATTRLVRRSRGVGALASSRRRPDAGKLSKASHSSCAHETRSAW